MTRRVVNHFCLLPRFVVIFHYLDSVAMSDLNLTIREIFKEKTVVIVGDLVADQYLNGTIARVSREAPVFILRHDQTTTLPGAAANAAANVASLGGRAVIVGVVGTDANGEILTQELNNAGVDTRFVIMDESVSTTTKVRILAGQKHAVRQQVIRIDYENSAAFSANLRKRLIANLTAAAAEADALIISDYNYGVADETIFETATKIAAGRKIPLTIDSRFRLSEFKNATSGTPNQDEVEQLLGKGFLAADCERLRAELGFEALLVTNGSKGMLVIERDKPPVRIDAVGSLEPVDVTGAGDTVIATYALSLASDLSFEEAARIANHAGGLVVMKKGTATVTAPELIASITADAHSTASKKAG